MRFKEIIAETTTAAGCIAPVVGGTGAVQTRGGGLLSGKYTNDPTPNTPKEYKRNKVNARGQFKNSIGN